MRGVLILTDTFDICWLFTQFKYMSTGFGWSGRRWRRELVDIFLKSNFFPKFPGWSQPEGRTAQGLWVLCNLIKTKLQILITWHQRSQYVNACLVFNSQFKDFCSQISLASHQKQTYENFMLINFPHSCLMTLQYKWCKSINYRVEGS